MRALTVRRLVALALLATTLIACGQRPNGAVPTPVVQPTVQHGQPTVQAGQPTIQAGQPTVQPGQPTVQPGQPSFAFEPRGGAPGTTVNVRGWNFAPNGWVGVYIGIPNPVGEALASVRADGAGAWQMGVVIPSHLPKGDPMPVSNVYLVVMNDQFRPQASAPFGFVAPAPQPGPQRPPVAQARENVQTLLAAYGTADINSYLASNLLQQYMAGQSLPSLIGFNPLVMNRFEAGEPLPKNDVALVPVTVYFPDRTEHHLFELVIQDGFWKVRSVQLQLSEPVPAPFPGPNYRELTRADFTADAIEEVYYVRDTTVQAQTGFTDGYVTQNAMVVGELLAAQSSAHGPVTLLTADARGVKASDEFLGQPLAEPAAAYLVSFDQRNGLVLHLQPLRTDGTAAGSALAINWDNSVPAFRLANLPPPVDQTPASQVGSNDAAALGQLMYDHLRHGNPNMPLLGGAVATAGDYAYGIARSHFGELQHFYFLRSGGAWNIHFVSNDADPTVLRNYGIPASLDNAQPMVGITISTLNYFDAADGDSADGYVRIDQIADGYARASVVDTAQGEITVYLRQDTYGWMALASGQMFAPEALDRLGIPPSVRQ